MPVRQLKHEIEPTVYLAYQQHPDGLRDVTVEIRTALTLASLAAPIRRAVAEIDRNVPVADMRTQEEADTADTRFGTGVCGARRFIWIDRGIAGGDRALRGDGVRGSAADGGNRHSHGAGAERRDVQWLVLRDSL